MTGAASHLQALSRPAALRKGERLGDLGFHLATRQHRRALSNLSLAYGNTLTPVERDVLVRQVFRHFGRCLVDFLRAPHLSQDDLRALVTCEGWEHVEAAQAAGRGVLLVTGHFGNWEMLGRWLAQGQGLALTVVAKEPKQAAFAAHIRALREGAGFTVLNQGGSARTLLNVLKRGETVLLLSDQNSGDLFTPFFGVPAGTVAGPASLALHTGAPLIPIFCHQLPGGSFHIRCLPPLPTQATGDRSADILRISTEMNAVIEKVVRQHPEQWLWLHNRWKAAFEEHNRDRAWAGMREEQFQEALARWRT